MFKWLLLIALAALAVALVLFGIAAVAMLCAAVPTRATLIAARAVAGLFWANSATHFPVWIHRHGPDHKTIWLALTNVSLLGGTLIGYAVGRFISQALRVNRQGRATSTRV